MSRNKIRFGYVRKCDLHGSESCGPMHAHCERIPVLLVPVDEAELAEPSLEGRIQFGDMNVVAPWTDRKLSCDVAPLSHTVQVSSGL